VIRGGRDGYDRLRSSLGRGGPTRLIFWRGLEFDPGCAAWISGAVAGRSPFEIARLVGAAGHVTGVDMDEVKLSLGRVSAAQRGCSTLEATADAIVEEGLASIDEVSAAVADLAAFTADQATVVGDPRVFQLWSSRPAA
jgi:hypothetical protein